MISTNKLGQKNMNKIGDKLLIILILYDKFCLHRKHIGIYFSVRQFNLLVAIECPHHIEVIELINYQPLPQTSNYWLQTFQKSVEIEEKEWAVD